MLSDDLIAIALGYVERFDQDLMCGIQYHFDLLFRTPLN